MRSMVDQLPHGTYLHCPDAMGRGPIDAGERPDRRRWAALLRGQQPPACLHKATGVTRSAGWELLLLLQPRIEGLGGAF